MHLFDIDNIVDRKLNNYIIISLTITLFCVHTSRNTPAKPMLFSDSMLKLSGLFFACCILPFKRIVYDKQSYFAGLFKGMSA
jgi:hypothetical protein